MPLVADSLLTAIDLLARGSRLLAERCIAGIHANRQRCRAYVEGATATSTALVGRLGYHVAEEVATTARRENRTFRDVVVASALLTPQEFDELVTPEAVMRLGSPGSRSVRMNRLMMRTPNANRLHIGIFGRRNVGKSVS